MALLVCRRQVVIAFCISCGRCTRDRSSAVQVWKRCCLRVIGFLSFSGGGGSLSVMALWRRSTVLSCMYFLFICSMSSTSFASVIFVVRWVYNLLKYMVIC